MDIDKLQICEICANCDLYKSQYKIELTYKESIDKTARRCRNQKPTNGEISSAFTIEDSIGGSYPFRQPYGGCLNYSPTQDHNDYVHSLF